MTDIATIFTNDTVVGAAGGMGTLHSPTHRALTRLDPSEVGIEVESIDCFSYIAVGGVGKRHFPYLWM
jgi:hypothetical protein